MNRRDLLKGLGLVVAGIATDLAIPHNRVWSFPKTIVPLNLDRDYYTLSWYEKQGSNPWQRKMITFPVSEAEFEEGRLIFTHDNHALCSFDMDRFRLKGLPNNIILRYMQLEIGEPFHRNLIYDGFVEF